MAQTLLATSAEVVAECFTFANTDSALVKNTHIELAQMNNIKPILGQELYDLIIAHKAANTLTGAETTLVNDYIKRPLLWYAYANSLINVFNQTGSGGIVQHSNEFGNQVSQTGYANSKAEATRTADSYAEILRTYLNENSSTFPLYLSGQNTSKKIGFGIILD
jgi:hypothetical protein